MPSRPPSARLVLGFALTGLTMRTAVTAVGAALDDIQHDLNVGGAAAGVLTTLPVICFAGFGALTPALARRAGPHRVLVVGALVGAAGAALRPIGDSALWFGLLSVAALCGGAVANVLMPSLVRLHFPQRIGPLTAVYSTALAVGTTVAAGLTLPIGALLGDGWRLGLASWSVLGVLAALPWLPSVRADRVDAGTAVPPPHVPYRAIARSRTARALAVFFAVQSMQAYIAFGWFARFLSDHGVSTGTAGAMVAVLSAVGIPVSLVAPRVPPRRHRPLIVFFGLCSLIAYLGLALAPVGGAWVWMVLTGIGSGMFPVALTLIALRARTAEATAALSAYVQAIGYVVAGCGPLLFGALFGATGGWAASLSVLFVALGLALVAAWPATADRYVDDELGGAHLAASAA